MSGHSTWDMYLHACSYLIKTDIRYTYIIYMYHHFNNIYSYKYVQRKDLRIIYFFGLANFLICGLILLFNRINLHVSHTYLYDNDLSNTDAFWMCMSKIFLCRSKCRTIFLFVRKMTSWKSVTSQSGRISQELKKINSQFTNKL